MNRTKWHGPDCRAHHKLKPCPACATASEAQRRIWQSPIRQQQHQNALAKRINMFQQPECDIVREWAGKTSTADITVRVNAWRTANGFSPRGIDSIRAWAEREGIGLMFDTVHSGNELIRLLGVSRNTIEQWRKDDTLIGKPWGAFWVYDEAELLRFVAAEPWRFDASRMAKGPLRQAHEVAGKRNPWLSLDAVRKAVPIPLTTLMGYVRAGRIPVQQRAGHNGAYRVQAASVGRLRELLKADRANAARLYSLKRLSEILGVHEKTLRWWVAQGWLVPRAKGMLSVFPEAEVIDLVTHQPWLVETEHMLDGPIRAAYVRANRTGPHPLRDRWVSPTEIVRLSGASMGIVLQRIRTGMIEAHHWNAHEWRVRKKTAIPYLRAVMAEKAKKKHELESLQWRRTESSQAA